MAAHPSRRQVRVHTAALEAWREPERVFSDLLASEPCSFWLDSSLVEPGLSRFSFMGCPGGTLGELVRYDVARKVVEVESGHGTICYSETIFDYLRRRLEPQVDHPNYLPFNFIGGFVGYFGYELKTDCGARQRHISAVPDATFVMVDRVIAFDHVRREVYAVCLEPDGSNLGRRWLTRVTRQLRSCDRLPIDRDDDVGPGRSTRTWWLSQSYAQYRQSIEEAQGRLVDGESYEICLTTQLRTTPLADPFTTYRHLRRVNPAPYAAYFRVPGLMILSSSPERFLSISRDGWAESKPIKGTRRRGGSPTEDRVLAAELARCEKDRAENLMIVDLLRNDLGRVARAGTVHVPRLMAVESYETVHQLVSTVRAQLKPGVSVVDAIRACFPGGSMTGAPKLRTMEIIDELEPEARGVYSGALGFLSVSGAVDLSIVIRALVSTGSWTTLGAGGAIVVQSDPDDEFDEMLLKASAVMGAVDGYGRDDASEGTQNRNIIGDRPETKVGAGRGRTVSAPS
jgi:aminodeoxychorismate synthase component I